MIGGVKVKKLKTIRDDRGWLSVFLRQDESIFTKFGQCYITMCEKGVVKAWHLHKNQTDTLVCVYGKALLVLHDLRKDSPTFNQTQEIKLLDPSHDKDSVLVKIPPMVAHGFTPMDCNETRILNIPDIPYNYANPDEERIPWNDTSIPYKWPSSVSRGG
ncbi:dTDP-4-dehydrorhamnose 3,5-epimerase [archaeon]|nr:MAG: dTDP-4-dehydrorhamnose 3,5-epimerase [archaeon]